MNWTQLAEEVINGKKLSDEEAIAILTSDDDELLPIMQGAFHIRKHYYGKKVKLNMTGEIKVSPRIVYHKGIRVTSHHASSFEPFIIILC